MFWATCIGHQGVVLACMQIWMSCNWSGMFVQKQLVAVVEGAGFEGNVVGRGAVADSDSALLRISGMTCSSCSSAVETALLGHNGVQVQETSYRLT